MSTRSGKRIHRSFHEKNNIDDHEVGYTSERKTRSKRLKENTEENTKKTKKRNNYVSFPITDNFQENPSYSEKVNINAGEKFTLQEQDLNISLYSSELNSDMGKFVRKTRSTRKTPGSTDEVQKNAEVGVKQRKKSKKKKKGSLNHEEVSNKSKLKKENVKEVSLNKSNGSVDSFHSAAGSPILDKAKCNGILLDTTVSPLICTNEEGTTAEVANDRVQKKIKIKKVSKHDRHPIENIHFDASNAKTEKSETDKQSDPQQILNATFEKEPTRKRKSDFGIEILETMEIKQKRKRLSAVTVETSNEIFEGTKKLNVMNSTFDKDSSGNMSLDNSDSKTTILNVTFEKADMPSDSSSSKKSLCVSSDGSGNLTFDKSNTSFKISISDDSNSENIMNATPVLIESSVDESQVCDSSPVEGPKIQKNLIPSITILSSESIPGPMKREGTFTKDSSDLISPKGKLSSERTPSKLTPLPLAGCTPFHVSRSSRNGKSMLNVTRSIEKEKRLSLVAEPRTNKVMFCSPVNNPIVVAQQKKKVIKSNLKGSNKSFIFDETVSEISRPATRKRSYTHNDAEDSHAKRKRLADTQQVSVDRLSRPRTSSVNVKLPEPSTPSKKTLTPSKKTLTPFKKSSSVNSPKSKTDSKPSRTKLPNFAALHQKQFSKMESLTECQERKARRARQLLTPNGAVSMLERSSPRTRDSTTDLTKTGKEIQKKTDTPTKTPKLPAAQQLKPGFTRFGFKLNNDTKPFNFTAKTEIKPKENKPNGLLTRQPSQPSTRGITSMRKETAKQTVMREKSFTSLTDRRSVTRKENRTTIKGVRTNRRFELQMKMRNIN